MRPVISLSNVTVAYEHHPAVHHLSGEFLPGSLTAIVGPNGAGKSTLLKAVMGELPLASGTIDRAGLTAKDFGYLPQAAEVDRHFPLTVADTVLLGAWRRTGALGGVSATTALQGRQALDAVGLRGFERRPIGTLSAGQFQRVLFARLLLQDARIILLDEPFTAIDARTTADLLRVVHNWHTEGRTVIAVIHDYEQVRTHFPRTLLMARQAIDWGNTAQALSTSNLARARTMAEGWDHAAQHCGFRGAE
ncbi:MAG: ABC transporter ATP-binding protein [Pseudomonas sp.]